MWLFDQKGFLSIVEHMDDPTHLLVRGRIAGDIEKHFPDAKVERHDDFDYLFRAKIPREEVVKVIADMVRGINYPSYKGHLEDKARRSPWYIKVWSTMYDFQWSEVENESGKSRGRGHAKKAEGANSSTA